MHLSWKKPPYLGQRDNYVVGYIIQMPIMLIIIPINGLNRRLTYVPNMVQMLKILRRFCLICFAIDETS